jgi:hypothetical protein
MSRLQSVLSQGLPADIDQDNTNHPLTIAQIVSQIRALLPTVSIKAGAEKSLDQEGDSSPVTEGVDQTDPLVHDVPH